MLARLTCVVLLAGTAAAGCIRSDAPADHDARGPGLAADGSAPAPAWQVGDWWTYRWSSELYTTGFEATIVVGEATAGGYVLGMPAASYSTDAILFHMPPTGDVTSSLAYDVHDTRFEPFRFPLSDGATWEATWIAAAVPVTARAATVTTHAGDEAGFEMTNADHEAESGRAYRWTYAPSAGWFGLFERIETDGRVRERYELADHGHGFAGPVRLLDSIDVVFIEARTAVALSAGTPAPPATQFTPPEGPDTLLVACVYGGAPGSYSVEVVAPSGTACTNGGTMQPGEDHNHALAVEVPNEPGTWEARFVAAGTGNAVAEVLGYRTRAVELGPGVS